MTMSAAIVKVMVAVVMVLLLLLLLEPFGVDDIAESLTLSDMIETVPAKKTRVRQ